MSQSDLDLQQAIDACKAAQQAEEYCRNLYQTAAECVIAAEKRLYEARKARLDAEAKMTETATGVARRSGPGVIPLSVP